MTAKLDYDWLRKLELPSVDSAGSRFYSLINQLKTHLETLESQTNSSLSGTPAAPPAPDALNIVSHPQGVQFAISHNSDFYQGAKYEIDCTSGGITHTYDVGSSRNGILPVGSLAANYQVRTRYPTGTSSAPVQFTKTVTGGSGSTALLPSQGSGTTRSNQPPGLGGAFTSQNGAPPLRKASK